MRFINLVIIINTVTFALDRYPVNKSLDKVSEKLNLVFFSIFLLEMLIKLLGIGTKAYFYDKFNIFDFLIVIISTVDIFIYFSQIGAED